MNEHIDHAAWCLQAAAESLELARRAAKATGDRELALRADTERRAAQKASERLYGLGGRGQEHAPDA